MANMAQIAQEVEYSANLQRARRTPTPPQNAPKAADTPLKPISVIEAFFVMAFLGIFFDLPQAFFAATYFGIVLNIIWVPIGYLIAYIWLKLKGRSLMGGKSGNKLFYLFGGTSAAELFSGGLLPGLSGFIVGMILMEKAGEVMEKIGKNIPGGSTSTGVVKKNG